jgi:hypothetical protein
MTLTAPSRELFPDQVMFPVVREVPAINTNDDPEYAVIAIRDHRGIWCIPAHPQGLAPRVEAFFEWWTHERRGDVYSVMYTKTHLTDTNEEMSVFLTNCSPVPETGENHESRLRLNFTFTKIEPSFQLLGLISEIIEDPKFIRNLTKYPMFAKKKKKRKKNNPHG